MAIRKLGKKGMFLTFISVAIIAAAIVIFTPSDINLKKDIPVIKTRVSNVNEYVLDLENVYLENALKATGRRTIIALIGRIGEGGSFSDKGEFDSAFSEVLLDGTLDDEPIGESINSNYMDQDIMVDNTYNDWLNKIVATAKNTYNIDTTFSHIQLTDIQVYQIRPWFIEVEADITFSVTSETASWTRDVTIKTEISVENFDDPYYLVKTTAADPTKSYFNKITKSDTKFNEWDVDKVIDFIDNGDYTHFEDSQAPSFLMRFVDDSSWNNLEFDTQKECCGIESLVNQDTLVSLGLSPSIYKSYVDYLFWTTSDGCVYTVDGFFNNNFDLGHLSLYKLLKVHSENPFEGTTQVCPPPQP